jgi:hypothetical protein
MKKNSDLLIFLLVYVLVLFAQFYFFNDLVSHKQTIPKKSNLNAKAVGRIGICNNYPPILNVTCNENLTEHENFYCQINATDIDSSVLSFDSSFITPPVLFNISITGIINFTPGYNDTGNYSVFFSVYDDSSCSNGVSTQIWSFEVININDPPLLIQIIPDKNWTQDTSITPYDLDDYFEDPDGDILSYNNSIMGNIQVYISSNNEVMFTPIPGFYGSEDVIFYAYDPYLELNISNNVTLVVNQKQESQPVNVPQSSGSSGGGGSGGSLPACLPQWYCRPWGICEPDGFMRRECFDLNNCTVQIGTPNITQTCDFVSTCFDGLLGPEEIGIDCGGPCGPCGTCYDKTCNNNEDCTTGLTKEPDCGGPCNACSYTSETCYDELCNNNEDCILGLSDYPDCGGPCVPCAFTESPIDSKGFNWGLAAITLASLLLVTYAAKKAYPWLLLLIKKKRKKEYESRLMLQTKITESILETLLKIESMIPTHDINTLIIMLSTLIRRYFKNLFEIKYEFTYEELIIEIKSRDQTTAFKSVLKRFFDNSLDMEFSGKKVPKKQFKTLISEFKAILSITSKEPLNFLETTESSIDKIYLEISRAQQAIKHNDLNQAYNIYVQLSHNFSSLDKTIQKQISSYITILFEDIHFARKKSK